MILKRLQLEQFRNYEHLDLSFEEGQSVVLLGKNGQGKTNLLEAIAMLALGKSFRLRKAADLIAWGQSHGRIKGELQAGTDRPTELELFLQRQPDLKKLKKNEQVVAPKEFLGSLRVVIFTPDQLEMVTGSPLLRRQFMDRVLVQIDPAYVESLGTYQRLLKHRNALLKSIQFGRAHGEDLDWWDQPFAQEAARLWARRKELLNALHETLESQYQNIAGTQDSLTLHMEFPDQAHLLDELMLRRDSDIRYGSSSFGPHRDDFSFFLNGRILEHTGSRGEQRTAVLALKLAELQHLESTTQDKALLLLDDVFSELDASRQEKLLEQLAGRQSFLTSATLHGTPQSNAVYYHVEEGELIIK